MSQPPAWTITAGSVVGTDHARCGVGCQDAFAVRHHGETVIVAVADGGGQASLASIGATAACEMAAARAEAAVDGADLTDGAGWHRIAQDVVAALVSDFPPMAAEISRLISGGSAADLGTTLTLVIVRAPWIATASVGDGFVVTRSGLDHLDLFAPPDESALALAVTDRSSERTTFLTSSDASGRARISVGRITELTGFAVSTDGLRGLALVHEQAAAHHPYDPFLLPIFARAQENPTDDGSLVRLLASPRITTLTGDDKTLVVAVRGAGVGP